MVKSNKKVNSKQLSVKREPGVLVLADKPYEIGVWAGVPQYRCKACKFDTLREQAMYDHIAEAHTPVKQRKVVGTALNLTPDPSPKGEGSEEEEVFEVELKEVRRSTDENGDEHIRLTIKE